MRLSAAPCLPPMQAPAWPTAAGSCAARRLGGCTQPRSKRHVKRGAALAPLAQRLAAWAPAGVRRCCAAKSPAATPPAVPGRPLLQAAGSCTWRAHPCNGSKAESVAQKTAVLRRLCVRLRQEGPWQVWLPSTYLMARAAWSYARAASSAVSKVPSQRRAPTVGSRISAAHLPQGRWRTPLCEASRGWSAQFRFLACVAARQDGTTPHRQPLQARHASAKAGATSAAAFHGAVASSNCATALSECFAVHTHL